MKPIKIIFTFFFLIMLSACQPSPPPATEINNNFNAVETQAQLDLVTFFEKLNQGNYEDAVSLYGGSFETLQGYNPDVDPEDQATLMKFGCEINGLTCLQVYNAELKSQSGGEFIFEVQFRSADGEIFVLGPCCGASEEEMPPVSVFEIRVSCDSESGCKVLDLPPYMP